MPWVGRSMDRKRNRRLMEESIRQGKPMRRVPLRARSKKRQAKDRLLAKVKRQLWARAYGECEIAWCRERAVDAHHEPKRSQRGTDTLRGLVALCRGCHDATDYPYGKGRLVIQPWTSQDGEEYGFQADLGNVTCFIGPFTLEA